MTMMIMTKAAKGGPTIINKLGGVVIVMTPIS